jgi:putative transposase
MHILKKIVDYNVSDNLNTQSSLVAFRLAIKQRKNKKMPLILHSDRGYNIALMNINKYYIKMEFKPA